MARTLTHLNEKGEAHMVDVGEKPETHRRATASATLSARPETISTICEGGLKKGDALATARIAGIMAAKKTEDLIPLCHQIALTSVEIDIVQKTANTILISATAQTMNRTGVEMEAMVAASVTALTLYDMAKGIDRDMTISDVRIEEKSGGKSGHYYRQSK